MTSELFRSAILSGTLSNIEHTERTDVTRGGLNIETNTYVKTNKLSYLYAKLSLYIDRVLNIFALLT